MEYATEDFEDESCSVLIVTHGTKEGALEWISQTNCKFPVVRDSEKNFYKLLGLQRSTVKAASTAGVCFHGAMVARGETIPKAFKNDYHHQLGGDFVVTLDKKKSSPPEVKFTYIHPCQNVTDRPTIPFLINHVKKLNK